MGTTAQSRPTLDQQRAAHAWQAVLHAQAASKGSEHEGQKPKDFGGQAKKLPVRIMASGLGQALAFLHAKKKVKGLLFELNEWTARRLPTKPGERADLLERIVQGDSNFLRRATDEVLAYLQWLNRFAEAKGLSDDDESN